MERKFKLYAGKQHIGVFTCGNGIHRFKLNENMSFIMWNLHGGFFKVNEDGLFSSFCFPTELNRRLPLELRKGGINKKIDYMSSQGLRVATDDFYFIEF